LCHLTACHSFCKNKQRTICAKLHRCNRPVQTVRSRAGRSVFYLNAVPVESQANKVAVPFRSWSVTVLANTAQSLRQPKPFTQPAASISPAPPPPTKTPALCRWFMCLLLAAVFLSSACAGLWGVLVHGCRSARSLLPPNPQGGFTAWGGASAASKALPTFASLHIAVDAHRRATLRDREHCVPLHHNAVLTPSRARQVAKGATLDGAARGVTRKGKQRSLGALSPQRELT
jgi:hypothetical protein